MTADPLEVPTYWGNLESHLQPFWPDEQRVAVALYRELAKGKPVDAGQLGRALGAAVAPLGRIAYRRREGGMPGRPGDRSATATRCSSGEKGCR